MKLIARPTSIDHFVIRVVFSIRQKIFFRREFRSFMARTEKSTSQFSSRIRFLETGSHGVKRRQRSRCSLPQILACSRQLEEGVTDTKRFCRETSREEGGERNAWPAINYRPMVGINRILGMEDEGRGAVCAHSSLREERLGIRGIQAATTN